MIYFVVASVRCIVKNPLVYRKIERRIDEFDIERKWYFASLDGDLIVISLCSPPLGKPSPTKYILSIALTNEKIGIEN